MHDKYIFASVLLSRLGQLWKEHWRAEQERTIPGIIQAGTADLSIDAEFYSPAMMEATARNAEQHMQDFSQQNLSNVAWAFAKLGHMDAALMDAIASQATAMVQVCGLCRCWGVLYPGPSWLGNRGFCKTHGAALRCISVIHSIVSVQRRATELKLSSRLSTFVQASSQPRQACLRRL